MRIFFGSWLERPFSETWGTCLSLRTIRDCSIREMRIMRSSRGQSMNWGGNDFTTGDLTEMSGEEIEGF